MSGRLKKFILLALAAALLTGVSQVQKALNHDRERLGLTRVEPLENAPPVLAFTTVALGGFRGLISNALWIRASDLQDEDKFFEMAQLADWITKLEPHFPQVWVHQAWNMAYNISVKFKDAADRWRWVQRGIELMRDEGLRYNPNDVLIHRELGWLFQHKLGQNLDDANMYYKQEWKNQMARVFGNKTPDLEELINPQTDDARRRRAILTNEFKLDPQFMKQVDERYGPLEWRLPEAHAIYWGALGLKKAAENPTKVNADDLIQLRRLIYQSMQLSFQRGRLETNPFDKTFEFGPNLDIIPKVNAAYEQAMVEDEKMRDHIAQARRNFLRDAVYFLYSNNRQADAAYWFDRLGKSYPAKMLLDGDTNSLPGKITLGEYVARRVVEDVSETSRDRVKARIEDFIVSAYRDLTLGEDQRSAGYRSLARQLWTTYMDKIKGREEAIGLSPVDQTEKEMLRRLLDPEHGMPPEMRAVLRAKLGMPAEAAPVPASTNAPALNTNAPVGVPRR